MSGDDRYIIRHAMCDAQLGAAWRTVLLRPDDAGWADGEDVVRLLVLYCPTCLRVVPCSEYKIVQSLAAGGDVILH